MAYRKPLPERWNWLYVNGGHAVTYNSVKVLKI